MISFSELNEIRVHTYQETKDLLRAGGPVLLLTLTALFLLPFVSKFLPLPTNNEMTNSAAVPLRVISLFLAEIGLYAFCTPLVFQILDEKKIDFPAQLRRAGTTAIPLFQALLLTIASCGLLFEGLHMSARWYAGLDPVGRIFEQHRILILIAGIIGFMLYYDFFFFGGWIAGAFYAEGENGSILFRPFQLNAANLRSYLTAWFYSWKWIALLPLLYGVVRLLWWLAAYLVMNTADISRQEFRESWLMPVYWHGTRVSYYLVMVPVYIRVQYFRLRVIQKFLTDVKITTTRLSREN